MEAPDKIYVWTSGIGSNMSTSVHTELPSIEGFTEYIRKDALIDWAKNWQKYLEAHETLGTAFVFHTLNEVIDKINSL